MVYLTHYQEYPIYSPCEGGYYYTGIEVKSSEKLSRRAAKEKFKQIWKDCMQENLELFGKEIVYERDGYEYPWCWWNTNRYRITKNSYYIGEGEFIVIERKQGKYESGYHTYC
jgi:hypothetical protein